MKSIRSVFAIIALAATPLYADEVTQGQLDIYPENPHLVQNAGGSDTMSQKESAEITKKVVKRLQIATWVAGAATLGCLGANLYAQSTMAKIVSIAGSVLCAGASYILHQSSLVWAAMAKSEEVVNVEKKAETHDAHAKSAAIADGIYVFSTTYCPPCKQLHQKIERVKEAFPDVTIYEYTIDAQNTDAQALIKEMGITIHSVPLTVVVQNGVIVRIISGFMNIDDYIQKLNAVLA